MKPYIYAFVVLTCATFVSAADQANATQQAPRPPQVSLPEATVRHHTDMEVRMNAVAQLVTQGCDCPATGNCTCGPDCSCEADVYREKYNKSLSTGRPLILWIACQCPPCEMKLTSAVHCRLSCWQGNTTPQVIVCKPDGNCIRKVVTYQGRIPSTEEVTSALSPKVAYTPPPMFYQPPMFFGGGGFGGGCSSGG